ncbi:hypothetical protein MTO96_049016 [Rhipicephalus appendiculatus]
MLDSLVSPEGWLSALLARFLFTGFSLRAGHGEGRVVSGYIENLQPDSKHVTNWDAQLKATKENTPVYDASRLPTHWLGNGVGSHGNAVNALWALRDFMLRDALGIARIS